MLLTRGKGEAARLGLWEGSGEEGRVLLPQEPGDLPNPGLKATAHKYKMDISVGK